MQTHDFISVSVANGLSGRREENEDLFLGPSTPGKCASLKQDGIPTRNKRVVFSCYNSRRAINLVLENGGRVWLLLFLGEMDVNG